MKSRSYLWKVLDKPTAEWIENFTGLGATEIVKNLKSCISSGLNNSIADGGACSVWLPGSIWQKAHHFRQKP